MSDLNLADLFAGGGGFSTAIAHVCKRLGKRPNLVAINHWKTAIETHKRNHPWAKHLCTGLEAVDPAKVSPSYRLNLLAASPECTHHSNARGGKPMSDQSRASAWLILKWLQELYVESVLIENVHEFQDWGPLGADGRPLQSMKGALFNQFISSLKSLGYNVEWRVLNAADYGGVTTRERLFIMARRGRNKRIIWPDRTNAPMGDQQPSLFGRQMDRWRPAREIIDWNLPSQSIFNRKKRLAPATLERIAAGLRKFGGANAEPFLVILRNHMAAQSINEPVPTVTAGGNHIGLCEPFVMSMEHSHKPFMVPLNHGTTKGGGHRVYDIDQPMPTITTVDAWGVVEPFVLPLNRHKDQPFTVDRPMNTITATSADYGLVEPFLVEYRGSHAGRDDGNRRVASLHNPLPTQDTSNRFGLVEPFIVSYYGTQNISTIDQPLPTVTTKPRFGLVECDGYLIDIRFRMLQWQELAAAMGFPADYYFAGTREEKVKQIGNAVEIRTAEKLATSALAA